MREQPVRANPEEDFEVAQRNEEDLFEKRLFGREDEEGLPLNTAHQLSTPY
jgi:hypothetical protein